MKQYYIVDYIDDHQEFGFHIFSDERCNNEADVSELLSFSEFSILTMTLRNNRLDDFIRAVRCINEKAGYEKFILRGTLEYLRDSLKPKKVSLTKAIPYYGRVLLDIDHCAPGLWDDQGRSIEYCDVDLPEIYQIGLTKLEIIFGKHFDKWMSQMEENPDDESIEFDLDDTLDEMFKLVLSGFTEELNAELGYDRFWCR
jgi:hypothetical protein